MSKTVRTGPVALQHTSQFIGRTMNWLYDHLCFVPRYCPVVICEVLANREEFPLLEAWSLRSKSYSRRLWKKIMGDHLYPSDRWYIKRLAPRVLHSHFGYVAADDLQLRRELGIPWFVSFYGSDVYQLGHLPNWQEAYAQVFNQVDRVLALGPVMAASLAQIGCPQEKIVIHPLGVDVASLPQKPRVNQTRKPLQLLFAGTLREKKGLQYVIEAVALARRAGMQCELQIVGDAMGKPGDKETKEAVFRLIQCLGLEDVVTHYPFLRFQQFLEIALRSHVFVAPSVTAGDGDAEGTPFVLQQMMATAMPTIATVHSDIPYVFGNCKHLLVPERNAAAIAERLQRYWEEPDTLVADGMALRERICRTFDVRKRAACLSELYDAMQ